MSSLPNLKDSVDIFFLFATGNRQTKVIVASMAIIVRSIMISSIQQSSLGFRVSSTLLLSGTGDRDTGHIAASIAVKVSVISKIISGVEMSFRIGFGFTSLSSDCTGDGRTSNIVATIS